MVDISDSDVRYMVDFLQGLNLDLDAPLSDEFGYDDPVLICLDAVLSISRNYEKVVKPRLEHFCRHWSHICSLLDLKGLIERKGHEGFAKVWNYEERKPKRGQTRAQTLAQLVDWFLAYKQEHGIADDLEAVRHWAHQPDRQTLDVYGIGFTTTQYLRMLAGVDTVKPDRHIRRAVKDAFGRSAGDLTVVLLLEATARHMGVSARKLDYALWKAYSGNQAGQQKEYHGRAVCR